MTSPAFPRPTARTDERDTIFARAARRAGTAPYEEYYSRRPELKEIDDRLRAMPPICGEGTTFYDPEVSGQAERYFEEIPALEPEPALVEEWARRLQASADPAAVLRELALALGALAVGICEIDEEFVYSHRGRHDHHYGEPIDPAHSRAVVFLVEMDHAEMGHAPRARTVRESARQYHRGALISLTLCAVLGRCGHHARSQHDAHYELLLPPLAVKAGLGELGRNNILIADRVGSRVRIGAVSCSLDLPCDTPVDLGAAAFCEICKKCADNCPARALSTDERESVLGVPKWPTATERCYEYWRRIGTDCGICMACCPFSHKDNAFHGLVRWAIRALRRVHRLALWCDDLVYGRKWSARRTRWL